MALYVVKFGGTSVANVDMMQQAVMHVLKLKQQQHQVVVVVSAMGGETDQLMTLLTSFQDLTNSSEVDVLLSTGEQKTTAIMAMLLTQSGQTAQSLQGWQLPIITTHQATRAQLLDVKCEVLHQLLRANIIPVISGFQGITESGRITTLGRGGSDITAIAVAAALQADQCILFKDVEGIATGDPKIIPGAKLQAQLTYDEMLEMTSLGAKVIQPRAVELAMIYDVPLAIQPTFSQGQGTKITKYRCVSEHDSVASIVLNDQESKICLLKFPVTIKAKLKLIQYLNTHKVKVDMLFHHGPLEDITCSTLTFTVANTDTQTALTLCNKIKDDIGFKECIIHHKVAKISLIGIGLKSNLSIAAQIFDVLVEMGISLYGFSSSELTLSILISSTYALQVVQRLSLLFNLQH